MHVLIVHQVISQRDAIGHDIDGMYASLNAHGVRCYCFGEIVTHSGLNVLTQSELDAFLEKPNNILIYHHSIFWKNGHKILRKARCKVFIKYHNITPPSFFQPYSLSDARKCYLGNRQTERIQCLLPNAQWLCDSAFNREDLSTASKSSALIVPPFHKIDILKFSKPNYFYLDRLIKSKTLNILFVGRFAPNKGHFFLLEVLSEFIKLNIHDVHLHIVGSYYEESSYLKSFIEQAHEKKLNDRVTLYGSLNSDSMLSFYLGCDFFLCSSEHEGFCVPLLEAQVLGLPVIARPLSGVRETLGSNYSGFADTPRSMALQLQRIWVHREVYSSLVAEGDSNFRSRFSIDNIREKFLSAIMG